MAGNGERRLTRRLGALDGAALIVSNVVGVGIFTTPGLVASMVTGPAAFLAVWLAGGLLALIGGLIYAELGGAYPRAGGEYVYLREAFGRGVAFLSGWTSLVAGFGGAIAAAAVGFAFYLESALTGWAAAAPTSTPPAAGGDIGATRLIAVGLIGLLALAHTRGLGLGRAVQNALAGLSVLTMAALIVAGLSRTAGLEASGWPGRARASGGTGLALVLVMFTYSGWNAAAYLAGELRAPARTLRAAVIGGTLLVVALYLGINLFYLRTVPLGSLTDSLAVADLAATAAFGPPGGTAVAVVISLALASGVSAMLVAGPRVYYAMARDAVLPAALGRIHPTSGIPAFAVAVQALWAGVLVLTGTFEQLVTYTAFAVVLFSAAAVGALLVLRRRPGPLSRAPIRAGTGTWAAWLFLLASAAMLIQAIRFAPGPSLAGAGLIALGVPCYAWTRRRRAPDRESYEGGHP